MKGALVEYAPGFGTSIPNAVMFQFNPETLRHAWTQPPAEGANPLAVRGLPGETFSFTLALDASDQLADAGNPPAQKLAADHGIYARLAALELLMFPVRPQGMPSGAPGGGGGAPGSRGKRSVPAAHIPMVLFVWGGGRIVPVRVTSLSITEQIFDAKLNPTHAEAQIELRVLTSDDLRRASGQLEALAKDAYELARVQREALALENLATTSAREVIALLSHPLPG